MLDGTGPRRLDCVSLGPEKAKPAARFRRPLRASGYDSCVLNARNPEGHPDSGSGWRRSPEARTQPVRNVSLRIRPNGADAACRGFERVSPSKRLEASVSAEASVLEAAQGGTGVPLVRHELQDARTELHGLSARLRPVRARRSGSGRAVGGGRGPLVGDLFSTPWLPPLKGVCGLERRRLNPPAKG